MKFNAFSELGATSCWFLDAEFRATIPNILPADLQKRTQVVRKLVFGQKGKGLKTKPQKSQQTKSTYMSCCQSTHTQVTVDCQLSLISKLRVSFAFSVAAYKTKDHGPEIQAAQLLFLCQQHKFMQNQRRGRAHWCNSFEYILNSQGGGCMAHWWHTGVMVWTRVHAELSGGGHMTHWCKGGGHMTHWCKFEKNPCRMGVGLGGSTLLPGQWQRHLPKRPSRLSLAQPKIVSKSAHRKIVELTGTKHTGLSEKKWNRALENKTAHLAHDFNIVAGVDNRLFEYFLSFGHTSPARNAFANHLYFSADEGYSSSTAGIAQ